ncbi:UDP-N-acetylglucosamine 4,6-dehydratase (inverting) [Alsobacter sp. R-9]
MPSLSASRRFDTPPLDVASMSILVTGGTGSFGRAFVKHLLGAAVRPARLVVFSRDEQKQEVMAREIAELFPGALERVRFFIGDVRDLDRLELAFRGIHLVVHAAAMKIVPAAEYNPFECILTNVNGAENVVKASLRAGVRKVIALSTDKAANPVNLYGASKLASDKIFVAANNLSGLGGTLFSVVRYGNVVGSRGSVVPFFRDLVLKGATEIPITDPRMTRFWISLEQGVNFVLSSAAIARGGEIFVPKIPSMKITDLASLMAPGLPHRTVGIRPGEKLHEVMITEDDARNTLELADRYVICPPLQAWSADHLAPLGPVRSVDESFRYASNTNPEWFDAESFRALLS